MRETATLLDRAMLIEQFDCGGGAIARSRAVHRHLARRLVNIEDPPT